MQCQGAKATMSLLSCRNYSCSYFVCCLLRT